MPIKQIVCGALDRAILGSVAELVAKGARAPWAQCARSRERQASRGPGSCSSGTHNSAGRA